MEYSEFIKKHPRGHFMQSNEWAALKKEWIHEVVVSRDDSGNINGSISILIRKLPFLPYTIMYSPRGPVCDINDTVVLTKLTDEVRKLAKKYRAYVFKIDPDVRSDCTEFIDNMKKLGYRLNQSKNFEAIQPNYVFRLDLRNKTADDIMAGMHNKTRYNIKVALKKGVEIKIGSRSDLLEFHKIMLETGVRDKFVTRSLGYFQQMYDCLGEHCRLYIAIYEGKIIAGSIAILYGDKVWYLYGASSNSYRNVMPNYLLQWEMIKWALENKCNLYDFRGVSGDLSPDNPLYGLYRFKKGYGGDFTEFVGEFELNFKRVISFAVRHGLSAFMKIRKIVFLFKNKK